MLGDPLVELGKVATLGVPAKEASGLGDQAVDSENREGDEDGKPAEKASTAFNDIEIDEEVTPVPVVALPKGGARHGARRQSKSPALSGGRRR